MRRIAQLLLAHADRLQHRGIDPERIDQGGNDGLGAALAQADIVHAAADGIGVTDHQKAVTEQNRIMQRIGDRADVAVGFRPDHRGIEIEINLDGELSEVGKLRKIQRARRQRSRIVADIVHHRLPHLGGRQVEPAVVADGGQTGRDLAGIQPRIGSRPPSPRPPKPGRRRRRSDV